MGGHRGVGEAVHVLGGEGGVRGKEMGVDGSELEGCSKEWGEGGGLRSREGGVSRMGRGGSLTDGERAGSGFGW